MTIGKIIFNGVLPRRFGIRAVSPVIYFFFFYQWLMSVSPVPANRSQGRIEITARKSVDFPVEALARSLPD